MNKRRNLKMTNILYEYNEKWRQMIKKERLSLIFSMPVPMIETLQKLEIINVKVEQFEKKNPLSFLGISVSKKIEMEVIVLMVKINENIVKITGETSMLGKRKGWNSDKKSIYYNKINNEDFTNYFKIADECALQIGSLLHNFPFYYLYEELQIKRL